MKNRKAT